MTYTVSQRTRRRFVLGCQGLWPGRRASGLAGARQTLRRIEAVQVDPLNVVGRSHDLVLHSRVADYRPEHLGALLYQKREFFDYGGCVRIMPMDELPYVRASMGWVHTDKRWAPFAIEHKTLIAQVLQRLRDDGPLAARDFPGESKGGTFRSSKDSSRALYYLWLAGELMTYGRRNFERLYAPRADVAPPAYDYVAAEADATAHSARKAARWAGLFTARAWQIHSRASRQDGVTILANLVNSGYLTKVTVEGDRAMHYVPTDRLPLLEQVEMDKVPARWRPTGPDTTQETTFLAPLDDVTRRAGALFGFEYLWEVYKPAEKRRWGYYTMPVLYGDKLVARIDPKVHRATKTLEIKGLWLEEAATSRDAFFIDALGAGLARLARYVGADRLDIDQLGPQRLRARLRATL